MIVNPFSSVFTGWRFSGRFISPKGIFHSLFTFISPFDRLYHHTTNASILCIKIFIKITYLRNKAWDRKMLERNGKQNVIPKNRM